MKMTLWHFKKKIKYSDGYVATNHIYCIIDNMGICFSYKGDEVIWVWPWLRKTNSFSKYCSVCSGFMPFKSLKEIDKFWAEYYEASAKRQETEAEDIAKQLGYTLGDSWQASSPEGPWKKISKP